LALRIAASTGAGLFLPMGFEFATARRFDPVRASPADMEAAERERPADLSEDIAAAIRQAAELPPVGRLRPITSPAAPVTALLRSDALIVINPDIIRPAPLGFALQPLPTAAGVALSADGDLETPLAPGEVRILRCHPTQDFRRWVELKRPSAQSSHIAIEAGTGRGNFLPKRSRPRLHGECRRFWRGHDVLAADLLWRAADASGGSAFHNKIAQRPVGRGSPERIGVYWCAIGLVGSMGTFTHDLHARCGG
jgi:starch synthase (maltosyl-transferring)